MSIGLENSQVLRYQQLNVFENMKLAKYSIKSFIPAFSLSFSENDSIIQGGADSRNKSIQFSLSQMVYDGGKAKLQYDLARVNSLYSYYEYQVTVKQFKSEVIRQYHEILLIKQKISIQDELIRTAEMQIVILEKQYQLGLALELDYLEYLITVSQVKIERNQLENELKKLYRNMTVQLGLSPEVVIIIEEQDFPQKEYTLLAPYTDAVINRTKAESRDLQRRQLAVLYQKKQTEQVKRIYLPDISLESSLSFSGISFPLTEPSFTIKCNISFNNALLPVTVSGGVGFKKSNLSSIQDSGSTAVPNSTTYFSEQRLAEIAIMTGEMELETASISLSESILAAIDTHDYAVHSLILKTRMVELLKRKLEIERFRLETGEIKYIDFLEDLRELSSSRMELAEAAYQIEAYERAFP
ncbi:MAG: TolC family protein [Treponema sp.]|nr:TolC family protein [Treponema sp.]